MSEPRKRRGEYAIYRDGNTWYVVRKGEVVYRGESKSECQAWVEEDCQ